MKEVLSNLEECQKLLDASGKIIMEKYPNSERLKKFVAEFEVAQEGLASLLREITDAVNEAEVEQSLLDGMIDRMNKSSMYEELTPEEKRQLAEHLTNNKKPLVDQKTLQGYIEKSLAQTLSTKGAAAIITMFPKAVLLKKSKLDDPMEAYQEAYDLVKSQLEAGGESAAQVLQELAKIWLKRGSRAVLKEFYANAFD